MDDTVTPESGGDDRGTSAGDDDVILRMDAVVGGYGATTVLHETTSMCIATR